MALNTGNVLIDAIGGTPWNKDAEHTASDGALLLSVFLGTGSGGGWSVSEAAQFDMALKSWSSVANVRFLFQDPADNADLIETKEFGSIFDDPKTPQNEGATTNGDHTNFGVGSTTIDGPLFGRYNVNIDWNAGSLGAGGKKFGTFVHEIGHALGLEHPHTTEGGTGTIPLLPSGNTNPFGGNSLDDRVMTIMSYNGRAAPVNYGQAAGPMAIDIAAIQLMYGAVAKNSGDTVYTLRDTKALGTFYSSIWDTGGTDTIAYDGAGNATIDLRPATLVNGTGGGGFLSSVEVRQADGSFQRIDGGFTIAADSTGFINDENGVWGVIIENAIGGSGNDRLFGNDVRNVLRGGGGDDHLNGFGGADALIGGKGNDEYVVDNIGDAVLDEQGTADKVYTTLNTYDLNVANKGGGIENLQFVGIGNFTGIGNALNNAIVGAAGADILNGGAGNDYLVGGLGVDTLDGGADNDTLNGEAGNDTLRGGAGNDTYLLNDTSSDTIVENADRIVVLPSGLSELQSWGIDTVSTTKLVYSLPANVENLVLTNVPTANQTAFGNSLANVITGQGGNNTLYGGAGDDTIFGAAGRDTIEGGAGKDVLIGGDDNDTFRFSGSVANLGADTVWGTDLGTDFFSTRNALDFRSLNGAVTVDLTANRFTATDGVNSATSAIHEITDVFGGAFDDTFVSVVQRAIFDGGSGFDTVSYAPAQAGVTVDLGANSTKLNGFVWTDGIYSIERVIGSAWDDTITGSAANETLEGRNGRNYLYGQGGSDTLIGGPVYDWMEGGSGNDIIRGTTGQTVQFGGDGDDRLIGSLTNTNYFAGGLGNDVMTGGNFGNYISDVDGGNDTLYGGAMADTLVDYQGVNRLYGGGGNDFLTSVNAGSLAGSILDGGSENDYLSVANGDYTLIGGSGIDTLEASGYGNVIFTGGSGADIFTYRVGGAIDYDVTDFTDNVDKILLWDFKNYGAVGFDTLAIRDSAQGAVISWNNSFEMTLVGVPSSNLSQADFVWT